MARRKKVESRPRLTEEVLRGMKVTRGGFTGDEIAEAAELYDVPFDSYGKLRAYLDAHGHMPPTKFLKCERKNKVQPWQY